MSKENIEATPIVETVFDFAKELENFYSLGVQHTSALVEEWFSSFGMDMPVALLNKIKKLKNA